MTSAEVQPESALAGVRVVDLTDSLAAYAGRLLADLGAEVIRPEPRTGSNLRNVPPLLVASDGSTVSAFERFVNAGKTLLALDWSAADDHDRLVELIATADVVIESSTPVLTGVLSEAKLAAVAPRLIRVVVTPFGMQQSAGRPGSDDLMIMAEGGLLHLGGYTDTGPVVAYGSQSGFAASIFAAVAAISGLLVRDASDVGGVYDVSAQECIAQALEDSAATYALTGHVRERLGDQPREAATGVYRCQDGFVSMVAGRLGTAKAWTALVAWLNEESAPGAPALLDVAWQRFAHRQDEAAIEVFRQIFEGFASTRTKAQLYDQAQARLIALSPVNTVADLLSNPQLVERQFFEEVSDASFEHPLLFPRAPYRLSNTPALHPRAAVTNVTVGGSSEDSTR